MVLADDLVEGSRTHPHRQGRVRVVDRTANGGLVLPRIDRFPEQRHRSPSLASAP
jgi:hypothetical protein